MDSNPPIFVHEPSKGMGQAVAERSFLRKDEEGNWESWGDLAERVAIGNTLLDPNCDDKEEMQDLISRGALLMSGRHLQHGDKDQPNRNQEVFTNCSTSATSFLAFYMLLNGCGVGRCYDDDFMLINWDYAPRVWSVLDESHKDYVEGQFLSARNAKHLFNGSKDLLWFKVPDSREGWAKALEIVEIAVFEKIHRDKLLVLDFSEVRASGTKISGMQGRPASGPVPLMNAFSKLNLICGSGLPKWKQALYVDHIFAECVLVGGARRAARMSTKHWTDRSVLDFIIVKRPVEYDHKNVEEIIEYRKNNQPLGFLWSSNNSITVDEEFWKETHKPNSWAKKVFDKATECAYGDGTGEPGFINIDKLKSDNTGWTDLHKGDFAGSKKYQIEDNTQIYMSKLAKRAKTKQYQYIINPCSEVTLSVLGAYCVLASTAPYNCKPALEDPTHKTHLMVWDDNFERSVRMAVRAAMRINLMNSVYQKEVKRTNRLGIGLVGIHEWAWARFGLAFREMLDETESQEMWDTLARMSLAARDEAEKYSKDLGLETPHTITDIPPGGSISKLYCLTEGAHLPPMPQYLRWIQYKSEDPLVQLYQEKGYPSKVLKQYVGHTIIGFPTQLEISKIMPQYKILTASDVTLEEQYLWLRLLEKYWLNGNQEEYIYSNQISMTCKFNPQHFTLQDFRGVIKEYQPTVKCCSVMPQEETIAFEYQPESPISFEEYYDLVSHIENIEEEVSIDNIKCNNGACSLEWNEEKGIIHDGGFY